MAKKENTVLSIDIGGDSLKMAEFMVTPEGALRLLRFDFQEYTDDQKERSLCETFTEIFPEMLERTEWVSKEAMVSLSGQVAFARLSKLPPRGDDKSSIRKVIEYEAMQTIPYPMEEVIWDSQLVQHVEKVEKTKSAEEGITPENPENPEKPAEPELIDEEVIESLIVAVKKDLLTDIAELIEDHGKKVIAIEIAATAAFNAARGAMLGEDGCDMILNIGGRCSSLVFIERGRIFVRVIPIAGFLISQQIAKEFSISMAEADDLKKRHGFVALGGAYEEPESEVAATISKIARNVMTKLHGEINRTITMWRSQNGGSRPRRMFLSGGGSLMEYTNRFFDEKMKIPVDYFNPFPMIEIDSQVDKNRLNTVAPRFSELIGTGLRWMVHVPVEINLMPDTIRSRRDFQKKKPYFYASCVSIILCLMVFYFGVNQRLEIDRGRVERARGAVDMTDKMVSNVQNLKRDFDGLKGEYDEALRIANLRSKLPARFNSLQQAMPDMLWLTSVKLYNSSKRGAPVKVQSDDPWGDVGGGEAAKPVSNDYDALELHGHSLLLHPDILFEKMFMDKLIKSESFKNSDDSASYIDDYFIGAQGKNNVTTFKIQIKLNEPVKL